MSKQSIFTTMGIILSFAIAIGGWMLTSSLINMRSDALLSEFEVRQINTPAFITSPPIDINGGDDISNEHPSLTTNEIVSILQNWESPGFIRPHEPIGEQISMGQAIEIGRSGLLSFAEQDIIPAELLQLNSINAVLHQNLQRNQDLFLDPIYSHWTVTFSTQNIIATLIINAVTGQIWNINVTLFSSDIPQPQPHPSVEIGISDIEHILTAFMTDLGIAADDTEIDSTIDRSGITIFRSFANSSAYAVILARGRVTSDRVTPEGIVPDDKVFLMGFNLYLSTQNPLIYNYNAILTQL